MEQQTPSHGIVCPKCGCANTEVRDSRPSESSIRRRRHCPACSERFTTFEFIADPMAVPKADGLRQVLATAEMLQKQLTDAMNYMRAVAVVADKSRIISRDS